MFEWSIRVGLTEEGALQPGLEGREEMSHQMRGERLQGKGAQREPLVGQGAAGESGQVVGEGYQDFGFAPSMPGAIGGFKTQRLEIGPRIWGSPGHGVRAGGCQRGRPV